MTLTTIFIDGDACPVREETYRVATRLGVPVIVVSNGSRPMRPAQNPLVSMVVVGQGADAADDWIAERAAPADICVTADIPLAARVLAKDALAVSPTGKRWTEDNIGNALAGRELARHLREMGMEGGRHGPMTQADRSRFLGAMDLIVRQALKQAPQPG